MTNEYEKAPERMMQSNARSTLVWQPAEAAWPFRVRVEATLHEAGLAPAETSWDYDKDELLCARSGYHLIEGFKEGGKVIDIAVIGRTGIPDGMRQGERDTLVQQMRAALDAAGIEVRVNEYGHIKVVDS